MKKFEVHYSLYFSESIEVEAQNEQEAKDQVEKMLNLCEIGDPNQMDLGERKVWVD